MNKKEIIRALEIIHKNGDAIAVRALVSPHKFEPRIVGALCAGEKPYCQLKSGDLVITKKGFNVLGIKKKPKHKYKQTRIEEFDKPRELKIISDRWINIPTKHILIKCQGNWMKYRCIGEVKDIEELRKWIK